VNIYKKSDIPAHLFEFFEPAEIGLEETPEQYIAAMVEVFRCVWDVLADDGTLWLNIGDSYNNFRSQMGPGQAVHGREKLNGKPSEKSKARGVHGLKEKDLIGIPWMLAFALRADGWYLRQDIIWHKPNPMPESVRDRCTKAHEYIFLLSKQQQYFIDPDGMKEPASKGAAGSEFHTGKTGDHQLGRASEKPRRAGNINPAKGAAAYAKGAGEHRTKAGLLAYAERTIDADDSELMTRNRRSVWTIATTPYKGAHFATFPTELAERCILTGSRTGDVVLDPFMGSGTTAAVAIAHGRQYLGCELNPAYGVLQRERIDYATALRASGAEFLTPATQRDSHTIDLFPEAA